MVLTLRQFCHTWWREVCKKVKRAVVFIDNDAAECLHWNGGLMLLLSAGAVAVKEFSPFESGTANQKKAVFITSAPLHNRKKTTLCDVIKNSKFEYCVLITAAHPSVEQFAKYGGPRDGTNDMVVFDALEEEMLQWMGNVNYTVEVFYFPLFVLPVSDTFFLTPPFRDLFPITENDLPRIKELQYLLNRSNETQIPDSLESVELAALPVELQLTMRHLVSCLHSFLMQLDTREDIYSMGQFSGMLASHLEALPAAVNRRKTATNRSSLILVDRTLDMCGVASHDSDSLLDRIRSVLPRLPGHSNDVAVNMSSICHAKVSSAVGNIVLAPGCMAHSGSEQCEQVMELLITRKQKDVMLRLHQQLAAVGPVTSNEKSSRINARITPHSLEKQVQAFRGHPDKIRQCSGLLQQTLGVTQTLRSPRAPQLELMVSIEKLLLQTLSGGHGGGAALAQITQLVKTRQERRLGLEDILTMLLFLFSLVGNDIDFPLPELQQLETAFYEALYEDRSKLTAGLDCLVAPDSDEETVSKVSAEIFVKLQCIAACRRDLTRYRSLYHYHGPSEPATYSSLLQQLVSDLVDPSRPEIRDLTCKSTGLKDLLKTGFSLLLNRPRQHHPLDNPHLIVFVVGGVTAHEVRLLEELVKGAGGVDVLVASTRLLTPADALHATFVADPLIQD